MDKECFVPGIDSIYKKASGKNIPLSALFELTHACNLRCRHCYIYPEKEKPLSFEEIKAVINQLAQAGTLFLAFSGGEALLRKDFFEIADYARKQHFAIRLFTNGTLIDEEMADRIAELEPLDVSISIYGKNASSHDYVTQVPGSFDASLNALKLLHERGIATRIKCLLMKSNFNDGEAISALARKNGAIAQFDPMVTPRNNGDIGTLDYRIEDSELLALLSSSQVKHKPSVDSVMCGAGRSTIAISPSGKVYPCVALPISLGNLREQSLKEVWSRSGKANEIRSLRILDFKDCATCADIEYCQPCLGLNYVENGDCAKPSQLNCWMARMKRIARQQRKIERREEDGKEAVGL